jgi:NDP-sugar pyrophosphorylase family protein
MSRLPVAILAGGQATRLRPLTDRVPKALLPIAGRPFIHWQLELLALQGLTDIVLCVGFLGEEIQAAVGSGASCGVSARYSFDGETPLGTGGALKRALPMLGTAFFVLYGDSYLLCSFAGLQAAYEASPGPALMAVCRNEDRWDLSNVLFRGGRIIEYNKRSPRAGMAHIDYGVSILSSRALDDRPAGAAFDLADLYHDLSLQGELAGLEVAERFYEIGSPRGIDATERYFRASRSTAR